MARRAQTVGATAGLLLVLAVLGWLAWAVLHDFWVLTIACLQP